MSIYTGFGDQGDTCGPGGQTVRKTHPAVQAVGALDELSAQVGWCLAGVGGLADELAAALGDVQSALLAMGAVLANPSRAGLWAGKSLPRELEKRIDAVSAALPPLHHFLLAGGCELACRLHVARTVCRRAELALVAAADASVALPEAALVYLNRLGDLLFVLARRANQAAGIGDACWEGSAG